MISEKELMQGTTNGSKVGLMLRPRLDQDLIMQPSFRSMYLVSDLFPCFAGRVGPYCI
ncbi:hypothetical protein RchiOBHm_Chr6g0248911 [Rosa chinensis]|uniref:Uncharacterized protein n=1 Tax=Rosa chinensis TaxID=74649 RepID=A0A2P6PK58_ROSCH|nr:hypothetical protein RchiOBHm_Chr6g0248911 [Rosa chinensis]